MLLLLAVHLIAADPPPSNQEVRKAYGSKVYERTDSFLIWTHTAAVFTVKEIRGWNIHFKHVTDERLGWLIRKKYRATAEKAGECQGYSIIQVIPVGPSPHYVKPGVQVEAAGRVPCK